MDKYDVLAPIAAALFGRVDRCRDRTTGAVVAIKRMDMRVAGRRRAIATDAAVHEDVSAELAANLKVQALGGHRFVLPMTDCFVEDDAVHLVLAHCARGELLTVVNAARTAAAAGATQPTGTAATQPTGTAATVDTTRQSLRYFKQVLLAMAFLHTNGLAHRDLSLENVLVDARDCCQVCDFGLATSASVVPAAPVGKVLYMAPEACAAPESAATYSPITADVWSLGVMLFAMLAGRYPFREPLRRDDKFRLLEDFGVAYVVAKLDVAIAPALVDLLTQCLVVDPAKRPSVATLLQHDALVGVDVDAASNQVDDIAEAPTAAVSVAKAVPPVAAPTSRIASTPLTALQLATIHPVVKRTAVMPASKEGELSQPEAAARTGIAAVSPSPVATKSTPATASRRDVVQRTLGKMFRRSPSP